MFLDKKNVANKLLQQNTQSKQITKVARDPEFDAIADNDFPAVIGSVAVMK
jgi:hypothetical protein